MNEFPYQFLTLATLAGIVAELEHASENAWLKGNEYPHLENARAALAAAVGEPEASAWVARAKEGLA